MKGMQKIEKNSWPPGIEYDLDKFTRLFKGSNRQTTYESPDRGLTVFARAHGAPNTEKLMIINNGVPVYE